MFTQTKVNLTLLVIFITAFLWAAAAAPAPRPTTPAVKMKRESAPISYLVALDLSRDYGYQSVNWNKVIWPKI